MVFGCTTSAWSGGGLPGLNWPEGRRCLRSSRASCNGCWKGWHWNSGGRPRGGGGRQSLPQSLPRERIVHDLADADKPCPCGGQLRQVIGEEYGEQLDIIPPRLKVLEQVRLKYACRHCEGQLKTPPPPAQSIPKSLVSPGLLDWLVVAKYANGLLLYRLVKIFARWEVVLSRTTLAQ